MSIKQSLKQRVDPMQREQHWNTTIEGCGTSRNHVHAKECIEENEKSLKEAFEEGEGELSAGESSRPFPGLASGHLTSDRRSALPRERLGGRGEYLGRANVLVDRKRIAGST